jgi:hypothetical protein
MKKLLLLPLFLSVVSCLFSQFYIPPTETVTLNGTETISVQEDSLRNEGTFSLNNGNVYVSGDFANVGTVNIGTSSIRLNGNTLQKITSSGIVYNILEINNTGLGAELKDDASINGVLTFSSGMLNTTNAHTLTLTPSAAVAGENNSSYVQGALSTIRNVDGTGAVSFGNIGVTIDPVSQNLGNVTITRRSGLQELNYSYFYGDANGGNKTIDRVWDIDAQNSPVQKVGLTLEWLSVNNNGININSAETIYHPTNGLTQWLGASVPYLNYSTLTSTIQTNHFSKWTIADNIDGVLVATLLNFTANLNEKYQTILQWNTEKELNCKHFEVERSVDNTSFEYFSTVQGHGSTNEPQAYQEIDKSPALGFTYYRLKQVDTDGTFHYSKSVNVYIEKEFEPYVSVFPNPSNGEFSVELSSNLMKKNFTITNSLGQEVLKTKVESTLFKLDIDVSQGVYFLNFSTDSGIISKKIVIE